MFFNKYPYTDFHELNADWIVEQFQSLLDRMAEVEETVASFEGRVSTLEGKMTTAEGNITNLQGRMTTAEGNITNLQGRMTTAEGTISNHTSAIAGIKACDLMNSAQLEPQSDYTPYTTTATEVKLRFRKKTYDDGSATATDWWYIDMPMASDQNAGLMYAAEAEAVEMLSKSGSNVKSSGGFEVTSVDTTNPHAVPDLQTVNTVTKTTIFDRDMYQDVADPDGPIYQSKFAQNHSQGKFEYLQNGAQKAFYLYAAGAELATALNGGQDDLIKIVIPDGCRPSAAFSWDFQVASASDGEAHGLLRFEYDPLTYMLTGTYYGQDALVINYSIEMHGFYMPFM